MNKNNEIYNLFRSESFKSEMDVNIKHILLNNNKQYSFKLDTSKNECYTDGNTIIIGEIEEFVDMPENEIYLLVKGLVGHEASHVRWSNFKELNLFIEKISKIGVDYSFAHTIANALEDSRIEHLLGKELPGYKKYISFMNYKLIYNNGNINGDSTIDKFLNLIIFSSKISKIPKNLTVIFSKEELYIVKKIIAITMNLEKSEESASIYKNAEDIIKILIEHNILTLQKNAFKSTVRCDEYTLDTNIKEVCKKDDMDGFNIPIECSDINIDSILTSTKEEFQNIKNLYKKESSQNKLTENLEDTNINIEDINSLYSEELKETNFKYESIPYDFKEYPTDIILDSKRLYKKFSNIFEFKYNERQNQRYGQVDGNKLWKITSNIDSKIFKKRNNSKIKSYGIYILIDMSASMSSSNKYTQSIRTAMTIENSLSNIRNVSVKTCGFNYTDKSNMFVFKNFEDSKSKLPNAIEQDFSNGCNRDGFAIKVALKDLNDNKFDKKLLIIISDGRPVCDKQTIQQSMKEVKDTVHEGRKDTTISSILINDGPINSAMKKSFEYMYEDKGSISVNVKDNPEDLLNSIVLNISKIFK